MKAIVSVIGRDTVGILSKVSGECAKHNANIIDVSQSVMKDMFTMIMMIDISELTSDFSLLSEGLSKLGNEIGMKIHVMHEDIFNSMHRI
ncbi:MAG: ACT domain-containing protein [Clostridiales bacterium]|nr:ACT domain-containing protein [Clostridiales bacterium]